MEVNLHTNQTQQWDFHLFFSSLGHLIPFPQLEAKGGRSRKLGVFYTCGPCRSGGLGPYLPLGECPDANIFFSEMDGVEIAFCEGQGRRESSFQDESSKRVAKNNEFL